KAVIRRHEPGFGGTGHRTEANVVDRRLGRAERTHVRLFGPAMRRRASGLDLLADDLHHLAWTGTFLGTRHRYQRHPDDDDDTERSEVLHRTLLQSNQFLDELW